MSKYITLTLNERVEINKGENQPFFELNGATILLPKEVVTESGVGILKGTVDFGVKVVRGQTKVERNSKRGNDLGINSDVNIRIGEEDLIPENFIIELYQLNESRVIDNMFFELIDERLSSGEFDEKIQLLSDNWTEQEALYALEIYQQTKNSDNEFKKLMIDEYLRKGKLNRSKDAVAFKLAQFKHLESDEQDGLGNIGLVFVKVWSERRK